MHCQLCSAPSLKVEMHEVLFRICASAKVPSVQDSIFIFFSSCAEIHEWDNLTEPTHCDIFRKLCRRERKFPSCGVNME